MIVLYHSGGASDFSIAGLGTSQEAFQHLQFNVLRVLQSRQQQAAAIILESTPFEALQASNHFGDEFSILHASLPLANYESFRIGHQKGELRDPCRQIADTFAELGFHIRLIAIDLALEDAAVTNVPAAANPPALGLTRMEVSKVVNRYIGVNGGYLGDFSYRTHHDFYLELDLDIDPYNYQGTTRERFIQILSESAPNIQARILDGILKKYPVGSSDIRIQERRDEITGWIARLKGVRLPAGRLALTADRTPALASEKSVLQPAARDNVSVTPDESFRFDFGISFAGNDRALARQLRDGLRTAGFTVFFDEDYEHEMIGHDGSLYLRNVYSRQCRFCIVLISEAYDKRDWTNLEREAVQARELKGERGILIPVPIENYQPSWLPETRIRFDLWKRSIPELVALLTRRSALRAKP
jgi:hypothetical protein